jgi:hypothetical protein
MARKFQGEPGAGLHYGARDGSSRRLAANRDGVFSAKTDEDEERLLAHGFKPIVGKPGEPDEPEEPDAGQPDLTEPAAPEPVDPADREV